MDYVLKANALCKSYHRFHALNGVTMNVPKGAIYGIVGKNGAGKTTLIRLICGLQEPSSGDFTLYGTKHTDKNITKARRRMAAVVETPAFYGDMSAEENMKIVEIMEIIAQKRGAILSGGRIDYEKISVILLDEFRSGKIGRITIEKV